MSLIRSSVSTQDTSVTDRQTDRPAVADTALLWSVRGLSTRDVKSSSWPRPRGPKTGLGLVITGLGLMTYSCGLGLIQFGLVAS